MKTKITRRQVNLAIKNIRLVAALDPDGRPRAQKRKIEEARVLVCALDILRLELMALEVLEWSKTR